MNALHPSRVPIRKPLASTGIVAALMLCLSTSAFADVSAELDRDYIGPGDTVQLNLTHEGRTSDDPDLSPLKKDFDILGTSSGSSFQIINGSISAHKQVQVTLSPKHQGTLQIPALSWAGESSQPLQLTVSDSGASSGDDANSNTSQHVFLTSTLDTPRPYVQAPTVLTVKLYTDLALQQASLDLPTSDAVVVEQLGKDVQTTEMRNGHRYQVVERRYALFPQHSGAIRLDGPVLDAQVQDTRSRDGFNDPFFNNVFGQSPFGGLSALRPLRLRGDAVELDVQPRPASAGADWLPVRTLTLSGSWQPDSKQVHAGEPLTLSLKLEATGVTAEQLPDLGQRLQLPDGLKAYPDQAQLNTEVPNGELLATRTQDIAVIASHAGRYTLPSLRVTWWDTASEQLRVAELPQQSIEVLPAVGGSAPVAAPPALAPASIPAEPSTQPSSSNADTLTPASPLVAQPTQRTLWFWTSIALALAWLITLAAWALSRRRHAPIPSAKLNDPATKANALNARQARNAFQQACRDNDAPAARRHLMEWARAHDPEHAPSGVLALAQRMGDVRTQQLLEQLDRACYAGDSWQGAALAQALKDFPDLNRAKAKGSALHSLYPAST
ncbi:protein BatD [Sinimarinibacterium sp. CAU 1509]|uniref:BatD family protein n=1 Tax=Sinimarinibacterium sp. CAU 1509 TaxID=2562283 RepID=UPI0010AB60D2|nr:BatD family protein [Sinimarinibacterium sp. CAU 1509]TJY59461.1 protein BatD [Sinimarinibacterium sp. CAU 1509]